MNKVWEELEINQIENEAECRKQARFNTKKLKELVSSLDPKNPDKELQASINKRRMRSAKLKKKKIALDRSRRVQAEKKFRDKQESSRRELHLPDIENRLRNFRSEADNLLRDLQSVSSKAKRDPETRNIYVKTSAMIRKLHTVVDCLSRMDKFDKPDYNLTYNVEDLVERARERE